MNAARYSRSASHYRPIRRRPEGVCRVQGQTNDHHAGARRDDGGEQTFRRQSKVRFFFLVSWGLRY